MFLKKSSAKKNIPQELRINTKGIYYYDFFVQGIRYRKSTGTKNLTLAKNILNVRKTDILRGSYNLPSQVRKQFSDLWSIYISKQKPGKTTYGKILSAKYFLPIFEKKDIKALTHADIVNYVSMRAIQIINLPKNQSKRESEISFRELNIEIATLSHFFNFCKSNNFVDGNPASGIKKLNEIKRLKTLNDDDIQKLIAGATNKLTRDLITFLIYTGCRISEVLNLKWSDVDLKNNVIAIKGTKTKYDRYIPIHRKLKDLLTGIEKNHDCLYVFNRNGAKIDDFKGSFHTACRNAGLKDMHIHDLRHVFASKMVMGGTSLYITGELLGHRTPGQTQRYAHLVPETLKKAVSDVWDKNNK
jgi:integrase